MTWPEPIKVRTNRIRARLISRPRLWYVQDRFPQGRVFRLWLGFVLVTIMVPSKEYRTTLSDP